MACKQVWTCGPGLYLAPMSRDLLRELPVLLHEGLITPEQAERIKARYADAPEGGGRMMLFTALIGGLLVGLGVILVVAHNWDDLPRWMRTLLAFLPVLAGIAVITWAMARRPDSMAWREGGAAFLACALCANIALISQIYHVDGDMAGYLLTCSLLVLPLLYLPGSFAAALIFLALATGYAGAGFFAFEDARRPFQVLVLLAAAAPAYLSQARQRGNSTGFWWFSLFMALSIGISIQFFLRDWGLGRVLGMVAMASMFTLVPWTHPGREWRTAPWVLVGGAALVWILFMASYRFFWQSEDFLLADQGRDMGANWALVVAGCTVYVLSLRQRGAFERWPWPEALPLMLAAYGLSFIDPLAAAVFVNLLLLALGIHYVRTGIAEGSLRRMNFGLAITGLVILLRFMDTNLSYVVRGLVFIAIGAGFLFMNLRLMRQRGKA